MGWVAKYRKWTLPSKIGFWSFVTGLIGLLPILTSIFSHSKPEAGVTINASQGSTVQSMVNSPHSTQINNVEERTIFRPPISNVVADITANLGTFKKKYLGLNPTVRIDSESGSSARFNVADTLGGLLAAQQLGDFARGASSYGVGPGYPMTLWFGGEHSELAKDFLTAIAPYVHGEVKIVTDGRRATNALRLYLNGTPFFSMDGRVEMK